MKRPDRIIDPYDHIIGRFQVISHKEYSHVKITGKSGRIWSDLVGHLHSYPRNRIDHAELTPVWTYHAHRYLSLAKMKSQTLRHLQMENQNMTEKLRSHVHQIAATVWRLPHHVKKPAHTKIDRRRK